MSIIDRFMRRNKQRQYLEMRIVWGIWAPRWLQLTYKSLAANLRVPISILVCYVLRQWLSQNYKALIDDEASRSKFGDLLAREHEERERNLNSDSDR